MPTYGRDLIGVIDYAHEHMDAYKFQRDYKGVNAFSNWLFDKQRRIETGYRERRTNIDLSEANGEFVGDNVLENPERKELARDYFNQSLGLLAVAENHLAKRTWGDILLHPFRSISENLAVRRLRNEVHENLDNKTPAELNAIATLASKCSQEEVKDIKGIDRDGSLAVEVSTNFGKGKKRSAKAKATAKSTRRLSLKDFFKRNKDKDAFDRALDKRNKNEAPDASSTEISEGTRERMKNMWARHTKDMALDDSADYAELQESISKDIGEKTFDLDNSFSTVSKPVTEVQKSNNAPQKDV